MATPKGKTPARNIKRNVAIVLLPCYKNHCDTCKNRLNYTNKHMEKQLHWMVTISTDRKEIRFENIGRRIHFFLSKIRILYSTMSSRMRFHCTIVFIVHPLNRWSETFIYHNIMQKPMKRLSNHWLRLIVVWLAGVDNLEALCGCEEFGDKSQFLYQPNSSTTFHFNILMAWDGLPKCDYTYQQAFEGRMHIYGFELLRKEML